VRIAAVALCASLLAFACAPPSSGLGPGAHLEVTPEGCDFAAIVLGSVESCTVTVANNGDAALDVTAAVIGDDAFDVIGRIADDEITPGHALDLVVELAAAEPRSYDAVLRFESNGATLVDVPLHGIALEPPQCAARVKSVNGVGVGDGAGDGGAGDVGAVVGDDVVLTLADSRPATSTGAIAQFAWSVRQSPGGSAALATPAAMETSVGVDVAGDYVVCGAVVDDQGLASHNECCASFEIVGPRALMVQASSSSPVALHVVTPDESDVYCVADVSDADVGAARDLAASSGTAPVLASACVNGRDTHNAGGAVIEIDDVAEAAGNGGGDVLVALSADAPADATVRLYTFGHVIAELVAHVDGYREIAVADVVDGAVCVDDRSDVADGCP
jgi:hypothetical protein